MVQFDFLSFFIQLVWFFAFFGLFYIFLLKYVLVEIAKLLKLREGLKELPSIKHSLYERSISSIARFFKKILD